MESYQTIGTQGAHCNVLEDCIVLLKELIRSNWDLAERMLNCIKNTRGPVNNMLMLSKELHGG